MGLLDDRFWIFMEFQEFHRFVKLFLEFLEKLYHYQKYAYKPQFLPISFEILSFFSFKLRNIFTKKNKIR
jgi:hypothetical protein